jgi:hypothetical protein
MAPTNSSSAMPTTIVSQTGHQAAMKKFARKISLSIVANWFC